MYYDPEDSSENSSDGLTNPGDEEAEEFEDLPTSSTRDKRRRIMLEDEGDDIGEDADDNLLDK